MRRLKASAMALIIVSTTLLYAFILYKPSDYEQLSELPTAQTDVLAPPTSDSIPQSAIVAESPRTSVVAKEANKPATSNVKPTQDKAETIEVVATFYTAKCDGCSGITKMGDNVKRTIYVNKMRVIAADPEVIPLGSIVSVTLADGTSFIAAVRDVGGAIKGARIDVLVKSKKEAYRLGRQQATVTILERGGR